MMTQKISRGFANGLRQQTRDDESSSDTGLLILTTSRRTSLTYLSFPRSL